MAALNGRDGYLRLSRHCRPLLTKLHSVHIQWYRAL